MNLISDIRTLHSDAQSGKMFKTDCASCLKTVSMIVHQDRFETVQATLARCSISKQATKILVTATTKTMTLVKRKIKLRPYLVETITAKAQLNDMSNYTSWACRY